MAASQEPRVGYSELSTRIGSAAELDALPVASIVTIPHENGPIGAQYDGEGWWFMVANERRIQSQGILIDGPVTLIYRPSVIPKTGEPDNGD